MRPVLSENVVAHIRILTGVFAQFGHPVRIGQKTHVADQVGIHR
ncbi:unannotated protein [freshwater metagenome]|uniref:Unannotated protein n=1 Tax=freshwater metagenome TaxID=449393 RepID=A0A6J7HIS0_9ZZZZ